MLVEIPRFINDAAKKALNLLPGRNAPVEKPGDPQTNDSCEKLGREMLQRLYTDPEVITYIGKIDYYRQRLKEEGEDFQAKMAKDFGTTIRLPENFLLNPAFLNTKLTFNEARERALSLVDPNRQPTVEEEVLTEARNFLERQKEIPVLDLYYRLGVKEILRRIEEQLDAEKNSTKNPVE